MDEYKFFMYVIFNNVCIIGNCDNCIFNNNGYDCLMRNAPYSYNCSNMPNDHILSNIKNICINSECHKCMLTEALNLGACSITHMITKLFKAWKHLNEYRQY